MKKRLVTIVLFLLCFSGISQAQEIKGIWAGAFEADDVFAAIGVNFDESKFVLRFAGNQQAGAIKDLQIKDGTISFAAESQPRANFTGKIEADKISGTFDVLNRDGTKRGVGVWNVRKVESLDFKDEPQPVSENKRVELPKPSGEFPIGRRFFYWTDESRAETITEDPNDKRKLFVQLWYPAQKGGKIAAEYYPNLEELRGSGQRFCDSPHGQNSRFSGREIGKIENEISRHNFLARTRFKPVQLRCHHRKSGQPRLRRRGDQSSV